MFKAQDNSQTTSFTTLGMGSNHCAGLLSASVRRPRRIDTRDTNTCNHRVRVTFDAGQANAQAVKGLITKGAKAAVVSRGD